MASLFSVAFSQPPRDMVCGGHQAYGGRRVMRVGGRVPVMLTAQQWTASMSFGAKLSFPNVLPGKPEK